MPRKKQHPVKCAEGFRHCYRCGQIKPLEEFARNKSKPEGRGYLCQGCNRTVGHKWRTDHPDRKKASDKKHAIKNKEKRREYQKNYAREWRKNHPSGNESLWSNYKITQAQYDALYQTQQGKCAICGTTEFNGRGKRPHIDHCHTTHRVRGLLCVACNNGIGFYERFHKAGLIPKIEAYLTCS